MVYGNIATGFILLIFGGLSVVKPEILINFRVWMAKKVYGAELRPSEKTLKMQKIMGILFVLLGFLIFIKVL